MADTSSLASDLEDEIQEEPVPREPIVFKLAGHPKPDMRIQAFDAEFHCHSIILKLYSAFFRKFLDSPDKKNEAFSGFRYNWVTKVDSDETWSVVAAESLDEPSERKGKFANSTGNEEEAFGILLKAMYMLPYEIRNDVQLMPVVAMADYYCALPILSKSLNSALIDMKNHGMHAYYWSMYPEMAALKLFPIAAKLRNPLLFRECLVWLCSSWDNPAYRSLENPKLRKVAHQVYAEIGLEFGNLLRFVMLWDTERTGNGGDYEVTLQSLLRSDAVREQEDAHNGRVLWPYVLRQIKPLISHDQYADQELLSGIDRVLKNNLNLSWEDYRSGEKDSVGSEGRFYCAQIKDEDLPWDLTEVDW